LSPPDVAIVGGGILGTATAALLAEAGASVELFERDELAAAASGRNSGAIQHPYDPVLAALHRETLELYRWLAGGNLGFALPESPAGVLLLGTRGAALEPIAEGLARDCPELEPALVEGPELERLEPALAGGLVGCRLETGYPVRPEAATRAFAELARRAGASIRERSPATPWLERGRARGVALEGERRAAGEVLVTAGPWTPDLLPTVPSRPISPVWGVVVEVTLEGPPGHVLEEAGVEEIAGESPLTSLFSLVSAGGSSALGSTFLEDEPDPQGYVEKLQRRGTGFVPRLADAPVVSTRACPRPQSFDGRPLLGRVPHVDGLWVAAGHGPWGISTGPAAARMVRDAMLGRAGVSSELDAGRSV
jgi:glycine oxidase